MSDLSTLTALELSGQNDLPLLNRLAPGAGLDPNSAASQAGAAAVGTGGDASFLDLSNYASTPGGSPAQPLTATSPTMASVASSPTTPAVPNQYPTGVTGIATNSLANPQLPAGTQIQPTAVQSTDADIQKQQALTGPDPTATFNGQAAATAGMQPTQAAAQVTPQANATQAMAANQAIAAQGQVDPRSTVQGQYKELTDFAPGQIPDWAKGAVTTANEQMAARGLTASTMAGTATTAAILQAALPIAQQDAATYAQMASQNLTNEQQAMLANTQNMAQAIFTDQAVTNAAAQFNATSTNQVDQFYKSLATNTSQFNAAQVNGMNQFNASGEQAVSQFNAQLSDLRQRFNTQNAIQIDQANVNWQRMINTSNTAATNAAQQTNATNLLGISNTAMANLWQQALDQSSFAFQGSQNDLTRQANLAMAALVNNQNVSNAMMSSAGTFAANLLGKALTG